MTPATKNIFLTGASGFLGSHFIKDSVNHNYKIYALTRKKENIRLNVGSSHIEILEGNINEIEKFQTILSECNYFIHLAGEKSDESKMEEVNVGSLKKILSFLKNFPEIKMIYISSCGVYGIENYPDTILKEDGACFPNNMYEKTKLDAEKYLISSAKENTIQYIILRPSNVFGENDLSYKLLNLLKSLRKGLFFFIGKNAIVNYVYVKYVTSVMFHFLNTNRFTNEIYNVNSPMPLDKMIELLKAELNIERKSLRIPCWLLYPIALLFDIFPQRFQVFNTKKYFALTNKKIYSTEKLNSECVSIENTSMSMGLKNLVHSYKKINMI